MDSGMVMYPSGHARNTTANLQDILVTKFQLLGRLGIEKPKRAIKMLEQLEHLTPKAIRSLYQFDLIDRGSFV